MKTKNTTKSVMKYGSVILLIAVMFLAWFFLARRENFEDIKTSVSNFPRIETPLKSRKGTFTINNKVYNAVFVKMNITKDKSYFVMVLPHTPPPNDENIEHDLNKAVFGFANAEIGSFYGKIDVNNMIYLYKNKIKSPLGSKFVLGKLMFKGENFVGLKNDNTKGTELQFTNTKSTNKEIPIGKIKRVE